MAIITPTNLEITEAVKAYKKIREPLINERKVIYENLINGLISVNEYEKQDLRISKELFNSQERINVVNYSQIALNNIEFEIRFRKIYIDIMWGT